MRKYSWNKVKTTEYIGLKERIRKYKKEAAMIKARKEREYLKSNKITEDEYKKLKEGKDVKSKNITALKKEIDMEQDLLFGHYELAEIDPTLEEEKKELDKIEIELARGNLGVATEKFFDFLQKAYDVGKSFSNTKITQMWAIKYYNSICGGEEMSQSDRIANQIINEHNKLFESTIQNKKQKVEDDVFNIKDLDKIEELYEEWKDGRKNKTDMKYFLNFIEDSISETKLNNNYMGVKR